MKTDKRLLKSLNKKPKTLFFWKGYILDWVIDIAIAGMIVYIITTFAFQNMYVIGNSMSPTLKNGETVLINKLTYLIKEPSRYDIVAFKHIDSSNKEFNFVKRIIGVPGDKIEIINNIMYVNDEVLENFAEEHSKDATIRTGNMRYPIVVPSNSYFVLGDNKINSIDSRYQEVGMIPKKELTGKIFIRIWPFWKLEILSR